jgi:hypothetical protein
VTKPTGVELSMKAWPADHTDPTAWNLTAVDRGQDRILTGRGGVRLSFYDGPPRMTIDDIVLGRV